MDMERRSIDVAREEVLERLHSRGDFLKLLGAAGVGAAAGASLLPGSAEGAVSTGLEPTDFQFTTRERFRPFDLLAKNFVQLDDTFTTNTKSNYTILLPGPASEDDGTVTISNGKLRFDGQDDYYTALKSGTGQRAPYATVIIRRRFATRGHRLCRVVQGQPQLRPRLLQQEHQHRWFRGSCRRDALRTWQHAA